MAIPSNKAEQEMFDLILACRSGDAFTNTDNDFYDKVEERFMNTGDFFHPQLDASNKELRDAASFKLDQVRVDDISENKYKQKYESIRSRGILDPGWAVIDQDTNSPWSGIVLDMITRIILARTCEKNGHATNNKPISVPINVITDPQLIRRIMKNKMSFQTLVNDHPPADASSSYDLAKLIRKLIDEEPKEPHEHTNAFKTKLAKHVHRMSQTTKTSKTIRSLVTEQYNNIERSDNGVKGFIEPKQRARSVRKALETGHGNFSVSSKSWTDSKKEYTNSKWKVYQGQPTFGSFYKDFGREVYRKSHLATEDSRPSIYVFRTDSKTPDRVRKAQIAEFEKIKKMTSYVGVTVFDKVFAFGQIVGEDEGKLLSEADVRGALSKEKEARADSSKLRLLSAK